MAEITQTGFPPFYINSYVVGQLEEFEIINPIRGFSPIFPTSPTNIEDVFKNYIDNAGVEDPVLIQYERMLRFRPTPFYRRKREQLVYYVYSTNLEKVFNTGRIIIDALDREDAAGQDVNAWVSANIIEDPKTGDLIPNNVFFHNIRVYQADETRDILNLVSAKTVYVSKFIIEYDYHTTDSYYN